MSFSGLLNHNCDIYHIVRTDTSPGYNLPSSPAFSYADEPDAAGVPCHFNVRGGNLTVTQNSPQASVSASIKLVLPIETDVRINDKIIDCDTGAEYTAEIPRKIRNHHQYVMLRRTSSQEIL